MWCFFMRLSDLFAINNHQTIKGISTDTRFLKRGYIFIPFSGNRYSEESFINEAIDKGVIAIVSATKLTDKVVNIIVNNVFDELLRVLTLFYSDFNKNTLIGITGTDGKTTTSTYIHYLLSHLNKTALIGTNGIIMGNRYFDNYFTTPILSSNYELLNYAHKHHIKYVVEEISSQGIANKRIEGISFDYAIYTNLSHEHLDTHNTMYEYLKTKKQLFSQLKSNGINIINIDDDYAPYICSNQNCTTYGIDNNADYQAINVSYNHDCILFDLKTPFYVYHNLYINKAEKYNLYNVLPAIIIAINEGISMDKISRLITNLPVVKGRLEKIASFNEANIYIDFAHTPNALANVLAELKYKTANNLIVVCGAAGEKDRTKRPLMGEVATNIADYVVFTSEDPRCEDPQNIINDLTSNVHTNNYIDILDRKEAIEWALQNAHSGDTIVVTGKGREDTYIVNNHAYNYSDVDVIMKYIIKEVF